MLTSQPRSDHGKVVRGWAQIEGQTDKSSKVSWSLTAGRGWGVVPAWGRLEGWAGRAQPVVLGRTFAPNSTVKPRGSSWVKSIWEFSGVFLQHFKVWNCFKRHGTAPLFFERFLILCTLRCSIFNSHFLCSSLDFGCSARRSWFLLVENEWWLETEVWTLGIFSVAGVLLLPGSLVDRAREYIYFNIYSHIHLHPCLTTCLLLPWVLVTPEGHSSSPLLHLCSWLL